MKNYYLTLVMGFLLMSCANFRTNYNATGKQWENTYNAERPSVAPEYVLYGIGDAGYLPNGKSSPAVVGMMKMMKDEDAPSGVIFLGDNIYPSGMPKKSAEERSQAEANLMPQLDAMKDYQGDKFIIPGNHDWRQENPQKGVERQEDFVKDVLGKNIFFPKNGCSGPHAFELSDNTRLIVFDSEWYTQNWNNQIDFNEKCDYKTRFDFMYELKDLIKKYAKDKRLIVAMHHPIFTNGVHGGKFTLKDHIFPLANLHHPINVPLPGIGLAYPLMRKNAGIRQDINGEKYKEMRQQLLAGTDAFENVIFLSGHEHNMQYILREQHHHIIAGSGSKTTAVGLGEGAEFSEAALGFSRISIYPSGESWVEFFNCDEGNPKVVFAKKMSGPLTTFDQSTLTFNPPTKPFVNDVITDTNMKKGGLFNFFMGKQYSELYNMPIKARVTNLSIKQGGLKGVRRGGGFQTNSIRLEDNKERDWVMRAVKKDPRRLLPDEFLGTVAVDAVDYFLTTAHPLAAYTISPMASAIDILHTKPELVYIPKQVALGEYNEDHGDQLYLFEDRPAGDRSDRDNFGNSKKIISTDDLVLKMKENPKHGPDQASVARARLFDMVIGDWDRHDDQWRWARFDGPDKTKYYKPVPRDRDQAYAIFQGVIVGLARITSPGIAKFQTFDHDIKNVGYFNFNARYFDRSFLNELDWNGWKKEIEHIQGALTNTVIHDGMTQMQDDFYARDGEDLESKVRSRRDKLLTIGRKHYLNLAKVVSVHGSLQDDLIEIDKSNKQLTLRLSTTNKKGERKYTFYERTFLDDETKEIRIYGLDGNDKYVVNGKGSSIKVRMIGGTDRDEYVNDGQSGKNHVYDYTSNSSINTTGLRTHLSDNYNTNAYDRKDFKYNHSFALPLFGANPDNGFLLGGMFTGTWHGFKKEPYKMRHTITGLYSFETEGFKIDYDGHFIDVFGKWNVKARGRFQDDLFSENYFGLGNESVNSEASGADDIDFYRVRNSKLEGGLFLERSNNKSTSFYFGPKFDRQGIDYTTGRLLSVIDENSPIFQDINYIGGEAGFSYRNVDNESAPHQGVDFELVADYLSDLDDFDFSRTTLSTHLALYFPLDNRENFIWAHKIGAGFTFADRLPFYHLQKLGAHNALRGFRNQRFYGDSQLYYSTDLRAKLFSFKSFFAPSDVGFFGGFDIGRVWTDELSSDEWHEDFGGGLWISPFKMAVIKAGYFYAPDDEDARFTIGVGFDF